MVKKKILHSEDDVKRKLLDVWLADHGFGPADLTFEYTFHIRLGRNVYKVASDKPSTHVISPRADILVRSHDGKNMLIIEVKAQSEPLNDDARKQGICYARLLEEGGIAPFVVLTNGKETKIYDSVSGKQIEGQCIPVNHSHVKSGFCVSTNDISLRAEALENFVALSSENLITFCQLQVDVNMKMLRGDITSEKKYVPDIYVERTVAQKKLIELLDEQKRSVILVLGDPQVGKTNFICHGVEEKLGHGTPCLFYPAIRMKKGLLASICEDFTWLLGETSTSYQIIHNKLSRILQRTGQRLTIFIDGWNEADYAIAEVIVQDSEKLFSHDISCVFSTTTVTLPRLLLDGADNPSHIAEAAKILKSEIALIQAHPEEERPKWGKIFIGNYTHEEARKIYDKYTEKFNIKGLIRNHTISNPYHYISDPFFLRTIVELYKGQALPNQLDEPLLLEQNLRRKIFRAQDLRDKNVPVLLSLLANEIFINGSQVLLSSAMSLWEKPLVDRPPKGLYEAGILTEAFNQQGLPYLDFYHDRERDLVIACWARQWPDRFLRGLEAIEAELVIAVQSQVGIEALSWFLKQEPYKQQLENVFKHFSAYEDAVIRRNLLLSLYNIVRERDLGDAEELKWIIQGMSDPDTQVKIEAARFLELEGALDLEFEEKLLINLLRTEKYFPFDYAEGYTRETIRGKNTNSVVLRALSKYHYNTAPFFPQDGSELTEMLLPLLNHYSQSVRTASTKVLGCLTPQILLEELSNMILSSVIDESTKGDYIPGIEIMLEALYADYFGPDEFISKFSIDDDEDEESLAEMLEVVNVRCEEYGNLYQKIIPIIKFYDQTECSHALLRFIKEIQPPEIVLNMTGFPTVKEVMLVFVEYHIIIQPPQKVESEVVSYKQLLLPIDDFK